MAETDVDREPGNRRALLAFRLGWTAAELLGRLRKGYRPVQRPARGDDHAPRLSVSNGQPSSQGEELWLAAQRLVDLGEALTLWPEERAPGAPHPLQRMPQEIERWLKGAQVRAMTPAALWKQLNDWSLGAWSRLHVQDDALARAFTAGMSLADTYWCLRRPPRSGTEDTRSSQERWASPLRSYRLDEERRRLKEIAGDLPAGISEVLGRHLRHWSIGTELYYDDGGQLRRLAWPYRRSHPLGLLHHRSPVAQSPRLESRDEQALQRALARQAEIWRDLVFGLRTPESYLYAHERRWVVWLTRALFFLLLFMPLGAIAVALISLASVWLGGVAVPSLLNAVQDTVARPSTTGGSDLLKLLSTLLTSIGAFVVGIRPLANWLQGVYRRIRYEVTVFFVTRRTQVPWNRELKG